MEREEEMGVLGRLMDPSQYMAIIHDKNPETESAGGHTDGLEAPVAVPVATAETDAEKARKHQLSQMAANMIIDDEPRGNYFVSRPGL